MRIAQFSDLHYGTKTLVEADRCFGAAIDRAVALGAQVAVISGDATDHALDLHAPAAARLVAQVRRLADHCPVLMLQGTYSHEPPGTLSVFRSVGGRHSIHVADRIQQVALTRRGWVASAAWCFEAFVPRDLDRRTSLSCGTMKFDDVRDGMRLGIPARDRGLHERWLLDLERSVDAVQGMNAAIAHHAAAKIPPASPDGGVIGGMVGAFRRRSDPEVPVQICRCLHTL